jgi:DNA polymerase III epsilon subunit-like protein
MMVLSNDLVFVDTETTGLDLEHDIWEVAYAVGDGEIKSYQLPHSLKNARPDALELNGYYTRFRPADVSVYVDLVLREEFKDKTLVGANPSFDAYRLARRWGVAPWHYRFADVSSMAMPVFRVEKPMGLSEIVQRYQDMGYAITTNDHSAAADVAATRQVFKLLNQGVDA